MAERTTWNSNLMFLLAMIGAAVGLGNIWRFPYVFFSNGQGAFLIPYLIAILILGLPFMLLEYSIGNKFKDSLSNTLERINGKFQIIAWAIALISFLIVSYYICIVGWDLNYLIFSFTKAWGSNPDAFFNNAVLHSTHSINGLFEIVPAILIAVLILWFILWYISHKDLNSGIGKFSSIFVPLLFVLGIGIAIYNMTLPGAWIGYMRFFQPDWSLLLNINMWLAAFGQVLFTLSLGSGVVLSYSSHLPDGTNFTKNAVTVILANCGFEIINAVGVFSVLGYMSYSTGVPFDSIITEGSGLAFVAFPQAFNIMGWPGYILGALFFFCILIAGITTVIANIEPLSDSISTKFNLTRRKTVTILVIVGAIISVFFTTALGDLLIKAVDGCLNNFALVFLVILECIIFAYIVGADELMDRLNRVTLFKVGSWWKVLVKYVIPIFLAFIWIVGVYELLLSLDFISMIVYCIVIIGLIVVPLILYNLSKRVNGAVKA